jgi:hypothetical protein
VAGNTFGQKLMMKTRIGEMANPETSGTAALQ